MGMYVESKQKLDEIRSKYNCAGDIIFRTAIQMVIEYGQNTFKDEAWFEDQLNAIDERHDSAKYAGKILCMTRDFEKAIFECAKDLANIQCYDLLTYVTEEVYFGRCEFGKPNYKRAMQIIKNCMNYIADGYGAYTIDCAETLNTFRHMDIKDEEITYFGWEYLFDVEEEDE